MEIYLNGQSREVPDSILAADLIKRSCSRPELVICELNGAILGREHWPATTIKPGDRIELVSFVGGG